jgi:hypothetical protein
VAAKVLDNDAGKEERREECAAPEGVHEGEVGRGERQRLDEHWLQWRLARGSRGGVGSRGRERQLVYFVCAGVWQGLSNSLEREDGERIVQVNSVRSRYIMIQRLTI